MPESDGQFPRISVQTLKGLNQRRSTSQIDDGEFDILRNAIPTVQGTLIKPPGIKMLYDVDNPILQIFQTNDENRNVIVQMRDKVAVMSEEELFGIAPPTTNLVPFTPPVFGVITAVSVTNPTVIQTGIAHNLTTGDYVALSGIIGGTFSVAINAVWQVTVIDGTHFSVASNCTVAPTDISTAIFTETINPIYNGDDEKYPEAMFFARVPSDLPAGAYGGSGYKTFSFDFGYSFGPSRSLTQGYQINPDGSTASFATIDASGYLKLQPGNYRISAVFRGSGSSAKTLSAELSFSSSVVSTGGVVQSFSSIGAKHIAITNENVTVLAEAQQSSTNAFFVYLNGIIGPNTSGTGVDRYLGTKPTQGEAFGTLVRITKLA